MSNYATKSYLKGATSIDTSKLLKRLILASIKSNFDWLDVDKLEIIPVYFCKVSNLVKNDVVQNSVYDEFVKKVNAVDSNEENFEKKIEDIDKKILDISQFIETQDFNRLTKMDARMAVASKTLTTKKQGENALDLGDKKNIKKL